MGESVKGSELWWKCNASKQQIGLIWGILSAKMRTSIALCLFVVVAGTFAAPWEKIEETEERFEREYQYLRKFTQVGVQVDTELENVVRSVISRRNLTMYGFSWSRCGKPNDAVQIKTLEVSPDPIVTPGNVQAKLDAIITKKVTSISSLAVIMKKNSLEPSSRFHASIMSVRVLTAIYAQWL